LEIFTKRDTMSELAGSYQSFFIGKGLDFEGYRKYSLHDDSKEIDWKASLRSKDLLLKIMREERDLKVFFLLDVSDSMLFASVDKLKCEYAAELVASLCFAISRAGDSVGLIMFSDDIVNILPAKSGIGHYYDIIKSLSNPKLYGGKFNFANVLKFLNSALPRNSIVIAVSDFIGLDNSWIPHFKISTKKFDFLLVIMVRDPLDNSLPKDAGQAVIEDPFSQNKLIVDPDLIEGAYENNSRKIKEKIKKEFSKARCETVELLTNKPFEKPILKFF
ncbi:unnamed protein product, partial [marine sediment metagenome]